MFWAQAILSFVIWVAYGIRFARRGAQVKAWALAKSPSKRGITAGGLFLLGMVALFGAMMAAAAAKAVRPDGIVLWAHLLITLAGLGLVHAQMLAMALLITAPQPTVTPDLASASASLESTGNLTDEATSS